MKKVLLIIMDGWGIGRVPIADAILAANTPFVDSLYTKYPNTTLTTYGEQVGLPEGQMGNSEVGHLNLGAGRIVYQELQRINVAVKDGSFFQNQVLVDSIAYAIKNNKPLHLIGLVSDGGVHSHTMHLKAICTLCHQMGLDQVFIHAFTDGRDCDPKSGLYFLQNLQEHLDATVGSIATITGRYYSMDRDKRWERIKIAYDALVGAEGAKANNIFEAVKTSYENGITDEFIKPIINTKAKQPIKDGDAVICFNFRTDRCREITHVLTQNDLPAFEMKKLNLSYTTMTQYEHDYKNVAVVFENDDLTQTLGQIIADNHLQQIRIAETEKYPHVTFFFSGGREKEFEGEKRIMCASPKVATYDLQPEMSAKELTLALMPEIQKEQAAFICLNFANTDMVGHTGVFDACIKAAETVDGCVAQLVPLALQHGYTIFLTADHGNSDLEINPDGSPNTQHSLNPVPLFIIDNDWQREIKPGKLADIAPTILHFMGLQIPAVMTGEILVN